MRSFCSALLLTALLAGPGVSQFDPALTPSTAVTEGDSVPGVGLVTSVGNIAINDDGDHAIEVDTDLADTTQDSALLQNGALLYQEGQVLMPVPDGFGLGSFDAVNLNNSGNSGWNFFLDNATSSTDSGIYFNDIRLVQEGDVSGATGFGGATPYAGFFDCKINNGDQVLVMASVDDPTVSSSIDRALMRLDVTGGGTGFTETLLYAEGQNAPGTTEQFTDFDTGPHNFDFNDDGDVMFLADLTGDSGANSAIYLNDTILAREGSASPLVGRNWAFITSPELGLSNAGDFVFSGRVDGDTATDTVIIKNGAVIRQEGDAPPAGGGVFVLTSFGTGPIYVSDDGDVLWYGDWDDPDTSKDTGLFLNETLLLQEGVSQVDGKTVTSLRGIQDGYALSDGGRYVIAEVILDSTLDAAVIIDRGPWENLAGAKAGSNGETPRLRGSGSLVSGDPISVDLDGGLPNALSFLVVGVGEVNLPFVGTTLVPNPNLVLTGIPLDANGGLFLSTTWPPGASAGFALTLQWFLADASVSAGWSASNAVRGTVE